MCSQYSTPRTTIIFRILYCYSAGLYSTELAPADLLYRFLLTLKDNLFKTTDDIIDKYIDELDNPGTMKDASKHLNDDTNVPKGCILQVARQILIYN